jgi:hypothetical protein
MADSVLWSIVGTLLGTTLGALGTFWIATRLDRRHRESEARDIAVSLCAEIADRSARCLSDYLVPWCEFHKQKVKHKQADKAWVGKFRPVDPVVYPSVAAKLGLLRPEALFPVVQFYFRLDALRREIDNLTADFGPDQNLTTAAMPRLKLITARLRGSFEPALAALEKLGVENAAQIEHEAAQAYLHVRNTGDSLREALRKVQ